MDAVKSGIAPELVTEQVKNTAAWLWKDPRAAAVTRILDDVAIAREGAPYLRHLLAAHFSTVATFVPTDVDVRIRHHAWQTMTDFGAALDVVDEAASWDATWVSERGCRGVSGHDGEWFSVRAGALGRAALDAPEHVDRIVAAIDAELDREQQAFESSAGRERLMLATIIAHNVGDLSRVVEQWPKRPEVEAIRTRFTKLGDSRFVVGGTINRALMALENHRFLALRKARGLRASRSLLLPIGPWFDAWGEKIATDDALDQKERAEVVASLLELHLASPEQQGCLRAIAGIHRATRGGVELYVEDLPARLRKEAIRGRVREACDVSADHFAAVFERKAARIAPVSPLR